MDAGGMKILVIVVSYNGRNCIRHCLSPITSAGPNFETLVVDNGSSDGTPEIIKKEFPQVKLIVSERNEGFGAANNIGFRYALKNGFDFVYLLNQDAWITPENIEKLVKINVANPEYGIVSPLQLYEGMTKMDENFSKTLPRMLINDCVLGLTDRPEIYATENRMVQAAHWLIRCEVLKKVGGFSPAFFHYGEDHNFCHRVLYWGYKIGIVPAVHGVHDREGRVDTTEKKMLLLGQRWKYFLSDPRVSDKRGLWKVVKSIGAASAQYKFKLVGPVFLFCKEIRRLLEIKKISRIPGAFLKAVK